jgi:hypothetical protein
MLLTPSQGEPEAGSRPSVFIIAICLFCLLLMFLLLLRSLLHQ